MKNNKNDKIKYIIACKDVKIYKIAFWLPTEITKMVKM